MDGIQSTLSKFITAFSKLDLEEMMTCFTENATSFFPIIHKITLLDGKNEICEAFANVINKMRATGLYSIILEPEDIKTQRFGDTAIVTFHIQDVELSRRTLVFRIIQDSWLIQHLHASNAPLEERQ